MNVKATLSLPLTLLRLPRRKSYLWRHFWLVLAVSSALFLGAQFANAKNDPKIEESGISASTPHEWARSFAEATNSLNVTKIVALASGQTTVFFNNNKPQRTTDSKQHERELDKFYGRFKAEGKGIAAVDYSITQFSNDFAFVRFTWEVTQLEKGEILFRVNSSYLLRLEREGWRSVGVMEQGAPSRP